MAKLPTNAEGLTFPEWIQAAGHYKCEGRYGDYECDERAKFFPRKLRTAWRNGEDPSEHFPGAGKRFYN
jgi:hypothetical protein